MREKLIYHFGGMQHTQSCYLIPKTVASQMELEDWGKDNKVKLVIFGLDTSYEQSKSFTQHYVKMLENRLKEVDERIEQFWDRLEEIENNLDDPETSSMTGIHKILEGIDIEFEEIQKIINRYGNKHDIFQLNKIVVFTNKCKDRYERLKKHKLTRVSQGYGI